MSPKILNQKMTKKNFLKTLGGFGFVVAMLSIQSPLGFLNKKSQTGYGTSGYGNS